MKSSNLEFSKHYGYAVSCQGSRVGRSTSRIFSAITPYIASSLTVAIAAGLLLSASSGHAEEAAAISSKTELHVSTLEGPARTRATFQVKVAAATDRLTSQPTGSVSFVVGERSLGSALLDDQGEASYTTEAVPAGNQKIEAVYSGDDSYASSTSAPESVASATSGVAAFTLSASSTALKVVAGGTATTVVTATPENGFSQAIALSCSGVPYASVTCHFSPASVTPEAPTSAVPGGTPALSTLSIQTTAASGALRMPGEDTPTVYAFVGPGILVLAGLGIAGRRRSRGKYSVHAGRIGLMMLLLAGSLGLDGCAQRYKYFHKPPAGNPGTPVGTYQVTVSGITGTGSSLSTAKVQFTLTVTGS